VDAKKWADVQRNELPGRVIQWLVGASTPMPSERMTVGLVNYSDASGPMEPHRHIEESILVLRAKNARVRYGPAQDDLPHVIPLEPAMTLHVAADEWHVFEWDEGGYAECAVLYGETFVYGRTAGKK
jgi:hypothetical protein